MRKDRPKVPKMRLWLVKFRGHDPIEVEAEHRGMARHYAKSLMPDFISSKDNYQRIEWARLK